MCWPNEYSDWKFPSHCLHDILSNRFFGGAFLDLLLVSFLFILTTVSNVSNDELFASLIMEGTSVEFSNISWTEFSILWTIADSLLEFFATALETFELDAISFDPETKLLGKLSIALCLALLLIFESLPMFDRISVDADVMLVRTLAFVV